MADWVDGGPEDQFIIDNYQNMTNIKLARELGRSVNSIEGRVRELRVKGKISYRDRIAMWANRHGVSSTAPRRGPLFTELRQAWVRSRRTCESLADELGWPKQYVYDLVSSHAQMLPPMRLLKLGRLLGLNDSYLAAGWVLTFTRGMLGHISPESWDKASAAIRQFVVERNAVEKE